MKYIEPIYELTILSTNDVIAASTTMDLGGGVTLEKISEDTASVFVSIKDVLGLR